MSKKPKPLPKPLPKSVADLPIKKYESRAFLERTQAFQNFRAEHPEIEDIDELEVAFLETPQGEYVAVELDYDQLYEGPISHATQVRPDGRLSMDVDMKRSRGELVEAFIHILNKFEVEHLRAETTPDLEKIENKFRAFDLVEKHKGNVLHATWEMYEETKGQMPSQVLDSNTNEIRGAYSRVRRWYLEVQAKIGDL